MRTFHQRVVVLNYCSDDLPDGNQDEFHRALGRAVAYQLRQEQSDVQLVTMALDSRGQPQPEIGAAYWPSHASTDAYVNSKDAKVNQLVMDLKSDRPQIYICGVPAAGKYGFHS